LKCFLHCLICEASADVATSDRNVIGDDGVIFMEAIVAERIDAGNGLDHTTRPKSPEPRRGVGALFPDPLDEDDAGDEIVLTTRRAIGRVALVATETASRFQREAVEHDPMSWLFAPRAVFDGAAAIDACLDLNSCMRGILVHGLGLGLDVERQVVEALLASDDDDFDELEARHLYGDRPSRRGKADVGRAARTSRVRMYTATIVDTRDNRMTQVFHASMARDATEVRTRLAGRFGPDVAELADIRPGVHVSSPPVMALVPQAVIELIRNMERESAKPHARTFAVDIEMGIQA
jgi:hypothetical protein